MRRRAILFTPFLHIPANELFGVLLQHVIDLVEQRIDVIGKLLVTFLDGVGRRLVGRDLVNLVRLARGALLPVAAVLRRHGCLLAPGRSVRPYLRRTTETPT